MKALFRIPPWLALFVLAPVVGELLSTSAPPVEFFTLQTLLFIVPLYGGGAIICRELATRWRKGWLSLLLLGAAYGIWEEGIGCMSFFNTAWPDLGPIAGHDHWLGVNWVWAFGLTVFHSLVSVGLSVAVVTALAPRAIRSKPWLSGRTLKVIVPLFLLHGIGLSILFALHTGFAAPWTHLLACAAAIAGLVWLARSAPGPQPSDDETPVRAGWWRFFGWGLSATLLFYAWLYAPAALGVHPVAILLLGAALFSLFTWRIRRIADDGRRLNSRRLYAAAAGGLCVMALFCVLAETSSERTDNPAGLLITGVLTWALLPLGARLAARRDRETAADVVEPRAKRAPWRRPMA